MPGHGWDLSGTDRQCDSYAPGPSDPLDPLQPFHARASEGIADAPDINCTQFNEDGSCYWANCTQAKANGECNIPEGSPHYCAKQDRDGDGLACEC
jgi:hypothetical protein